MGEFDFFFFLSITSELNVFGGETNTVLGLKTRNAAHPFQVNEDFVVRIARHNMDWDALLVKTVLNSLYVAGNPDLPRESATSQVDLPLEIMVSPIEMHP